MEFCEKCGAELNEQGVCPKCSAEATEAEVEEVVEEKAEEVVEEVNPVVEEAQPVFEEIAEEKTENPAKPDMGVIKRIIAAVVALAVIIGCFVLTGRSYKTVAKNYMDAVLKNEPQKIAKLIPKDTVNLYIDAAYDGNKDKFYESVNDLSDLSREIKDKEINPKKVKVKIKDAEDLSKEEINSAKLAFHSKKIKQGKKVNLEVKLPDEDNAREYYVKTVKKGRKWYYIAAGRKK